MKSKIYSISSIYETIKRSRGNPACSQTSSCGAARKWLLRGAHQQSPSAASGSDATISSTSKAAARASETVARVFESDDGQLQELCTPSFFA